jgi:hypothetical protein
MKSAEEHLAAFRESDASLATRAAVLRTRAVVVPLLEDLGYRLGREVDSASASSAFILSSQVEKRLTAIAGSLRED